MIEIQPNKKYRQLDTLWELKDDSFFAFHDGSLSSEVSIQVCDYLWNMGQSVRSIEIMIQESFNEET